MGYVELELKRSVHVINAFNQLHVIHTSFYYCFQCFIHIGSEKCEKTSHATTNHLAICMHNEISIAMHGIIQMKLYRADSTCAGNYVIALC